VRLVSATGNVVELNYMWLPTFIGQNAAFKKKLEQDLRGQIEGLELTPVNLDRIHGMVMDYILEEFKIEGLFDYLDGLKFVQAGTDGG
jgi:hypothetical protein